MTPVASQDPSRIITGMISAGPLRAVFRVAVIIALAAGVVAVGSPVALRSLVAPHLFTSAADVPAAQAAIVPGASVVRGEPSPVLAQRANAAIELYQAGRVEAILVTGDDRAPSHDEVTPVRKYLVAAGVPPSHIFLDHAGFDTYSSMYRARAVFGIERGIIVTQDFHLPRAVFIARMLGMDASGYVAPGTERSPYEYLREIPASLKALADLAVSRTPQEQGEPVRIGGDGTATW